MNALPDKSNRVDLKSGKIIKTRKRVMTQLDQNTDNISVRPSEFRGAAQTGS